MDTDDLLFPTLEDAVKMYTVSRAMRILDVSRNTMMQWLTEGRFPGAEKGEGVTDPWLIPASDVEAVRQERLAELDDRIQEMQEMRSRISDAIVKF